MTWPTPLNIMARLVNTSSAFALTLAAYAVVSAGNDAAASILQAIAPAQSDTATPSVSVHLDTPGNVSAMQFDLLYDQAQFDLVGVGPGPAANDAGKSVVFQPVEPGRARVIVSGLNRDTLDAGQVVQLNFQTVMGATGKLRIAFDNTVASDPNGSRLNLDIAVADELALRPEKKFQEETVQTDKTGKEAGPREGTGSGPSDAPGGSVLASGADNASSSTPGGGFVTPRGAVLSDGEQDEGGGEVSRTMRTARAQSSDSSLPSSSTPIVDDWLRRRSLRHGETTGGVGRSWARRGPLVDNGPGPGYLPAPGDSAAARSAVPATAKSGNSPPSSPSDADPAGLIVLFAAIGAVALGVFLRQ